MLHLEHENFGHENICKYMTLCQKVLMLGELTDFSCWGLDLLKIKECWKPFFFEIVCWICTWNEWDFSNQTSGGFIDSCNKQKKNWNLTAKNGHWCTEWSLSLWFQTSGNQMSHWFVCGKHHFIWVIQH